MMVSVISFVCPAVLLFCIGGSKKWMLMEESGECKDFPPSLVQAETSFRLHRPTLQLADFQLPFCAPKDKHYLF